MLEAGIGAAVDVGSNSIHLLVAYYDREGLQTLRDESVLLNLGRVVDEHAEIPFPTLQQIRGALTVHRRAAQAEGANRLTLLATEPLRRATNASHVSSEVERRFGTPLHVLDERQEGELTYLGVTGGRPHQERLLIVDIGGGSTEVVLATPGERPRVLSLSSGSGRLSRRIVEHDPPTADELDALRTAARQLVDELPAERPARAVFVGGTATNLVRVAALDEHGLASARRAFAALPVAEVSRHFVVNPMRARQLPAGAAIVEALLEHFALPAAEVSQASLRDGAIIATARLGADWPRRLSALVGRVPPPEGP